MHHRGKIRWESYISYVGGDVDDVDLCDCERMSIHELNQMVEELGHIQEIKMYYYLEPTKDLNSGLRELCTDADVNKFCTLAYEYKVMEVYCNHLTIEEIDQVLMEAASRGNSVEPEKMWCGNRRTR